MYLCFWISLEITDAGVDCMTSPNCQTFHKLGLTVESYHKMPRNLNWIDVTLSVYSHWEPKKHRNSENY